METFQHILIGLVLFAGVCALVIMTFGGSPRVGRFTDADADGEPDETPEAKRRALESDSKPGR